MRDASYLNWPFFEPRHRALAEKLDAWAADNLGDIDHRDTDAACRTLVTQLGEGGWLQLTAPGEDEERLDVRSLALARETLARHAGLADFAFAMQGLGAGPISLFGSDDAARGLAAEDPRGHGDCRIRSHRGRLRLGCRQYHDHGAARRRRLTCSTAKRPGFRTAASPIFTWCLRAPAKRRARAGFRPSSSRAAIPA